MFPYILIGLCILVILLTQLNREHMSNDDMMKMLSTFGDKSKKKDSKKSTGPTGMTVEGPRVQEPPPPSKDDPSGSSSKSVTAGDYPVIYGPDIPMVPGTKKQSPNHESDHVVDDTYTFNPDLQKAFPVSGPPEPYLNDFSKIGI